MNCSLARQLMDDYLEQSLAPRERGRLEMHLASCPPCGEELRHRLSFERQLQQALGASVQNRVLSTGSSAAIVREAEDGLLRAVRSKRVALVLRVLAATAAVALVLIGLRFLADHFPLPSDLRPVALFPVKQLTSATSGRPAPRQPPLRVQPASQPDSLDPLLASPAPGDRPALTIIDDRSFMEPVRMVPGQAFTITLALRNDMPEPPESVRLDLEISGPTGYYQFALSLEGSLPVNGISLLHITPAALAAPCQEKYLITPTQIFGLPGVYRLRYTLFSPATSHK